MGDINALVVFYSRYGAAERLALAAGLGAIQADANIRLRRFADRADAGDDRSGRPVEDEPRSDEQATTWFRGLPIRYGLTDHPRNASGFLEGAGVVRRVTVIAGIDGRQVAAPLAPGNPDSTLKPIYAASACCGLIVAPCGELSDDPIATARSFGHRVTEMARTLKRGERGRESFNEDIEIRPIQCPRKMTPDPISRDRPIHFGPPISRIRIVRRVGDVGLPRRPAGRTPLAPSSAPWPRRFR